jgi:hypothetical protein
MAMGDALADEVQRVLQLYGLTVDVVIPVKLSTFRVLPRGLTSRDVGSRHIQGCRPQFGAKTAVALPGRIHQEQVRWEDVHHAWSANEVSESSVLIPVP